MLIASLALLGMAQGAPLRALIVGGGPEPKYNQVAIESNVRYLGRLIPPQTAARVLFADGSPTTETVQYLDSQNKEAYRAADLFRMDGPSQRAPFLAEFQTLITDVKKSPKSPVLLYFTGHGSPNPPSEFQNNYFDLWGQPGLTVRELGEAIDTLPKSTPVALVMVQCYSGAFGNTLFERGDPQGPIREQNFCGFFASVSQRTAAGCTPEVNEANYRDFTGYFFAALTGTSRLGAPVTGADYNSDGKVGMDEAFAYTLINDESIDTPVCTSDVFLRRFVEQTDDEVMATPYANLEKWASPAQLAALRALSPAAGLEGEGRLRTAYDTLLRMPTRANGPKEVNTIRFVRLGKSIVLAQTLRTKGDRKLRSRFAELLKAEAANPLAVKPAKG
ncbi:MAG: hypothetical protein ACOYON_00605 [Fimbriimonas sp.]